MNIKTKQIVASSILGLALLGIGAFGLMQVKKDTLGVDDDLNTNLVKDKKGGIQVVNLTKEEETTESVNFKKEIPSKIVEGVEQKKRTTTDNKRNNY